MYFQYFNVYPMVSFSRFLFCISKRWRPILNHFCIDLRINIEEKSPSASIHWYEWNTLFRLRCRYRYMKFNMLFRVPLVVGTDETDVIVETKISYACTSFLWLETEMHSITHKECRITSATGQPNELKREMRMCRHTLAWVWVFSVGIVNVCSVLETKTETCETQGKLRMLRRPLNKLFQRIFIFWMFRYRSYVVHMFSFGLCSTSTRR